MTDINHRSGPKRESQEEGPHEILIRGLLRAYYWMDESLQNGLQQKGYRPRTRTQTMILIHISHGITRAAELARALGISRQAIQQQINELEKDDLITQLPDQSDKRANRIVFSEQGAALINQAMQTLRDTEQALSDRVGHENLDQMRQLLTSDWGPVIGEKRALGRKRTAS